VAVVRVDGFEHGSIAAGAAGIYNTSVGTPAIVTSPVRTGARALEITAAGAAERLGYDYVAGVRQPAGSFYVRFVTLPTTVVTIAAFNNANGSGLFQFDFNVNRFAVSVNNLGRTAVGPTIVANTWYLVDASFDCAGGSAIMSAAIDGGGSVSCPPRTQVSADCTSHHLGTAQADTVTAYYDDWIVSDDYPADFPIGGHSVESLIATADGTHSTGTGGYDSNTGTAFNNSTTNGNTFIGHRPLQLADTANQVIRQTTNDVASYMEFTLGNLAAGNATPFAVRTYIAAIEAGTGSSNAEMRLLLSTNTEVTVTDPTLGVVSALDVLDTIATTVTSLHRMTVDPAGGWDRTKVDGLKLRLGFADGAPDVNFIDFMVEVALLAERIDATPSAVAGVAAVGTPTITLGAASQPDTVTGVAAIPTPTIRADGTATPATVAAVAAVPTPSAIAGGNANANPATVAAVVAIGTPTITAITPTVSPDFYSDGYGQGYETISEAPPVVPSAPIVIVESPLLRVRIDFVNDMGVMTGTMPDPIWVDVTARVLREPLSTARGRKRLMDRIEAGQLSLTFFDDDRALDPSNVESPFYPGVGPDRRIQVEAVTSWQSEAFTQGESFVGGDDLVGGGDTFHYIPIFDGLTEELTYSYPGPGRWSTVQVRASDYLALASRDEVAFAIPATYVWIAFEAALDTRTYMGRDEYPSDPNTPSVLRKIDPDVTRVAFTNINNVPLTQALDMITASGGGNFYIGPDGSPTYRDRSAFDAPSKMTFAVDAERYRDVQFSFDNALVINDVTFNGFVTDVFGANQPTSIRRTDEASKQRHPGRSPITVDTIVADAQILEDRAREMLANNAFPIRYIARLEVTKAPEDWLPILSLDLWDKITLSVRLPNGDIVEQQSLIEGIEITTSGFNDWLVVWWLSVIPNHQLLTIADQSFEDPSPTVGGFTAQSNCTIESTNQEWSVHRSGHNDRLVAAYRPLTPPHGQYALWVKSVTAGSFFTRSVAYEITPRGNYLVEYKLRQARYLEDQTEIVGYNTVGPYRMEMEWYDAAMVLLSTDIGPDLFPTRTSSGWQPSWTPSGGGGSTPASTLPAIYTDWFLLTLTKRAPSGASFMRIRVGWVGTGRSGFFMDDGVLTRITG
jgi:hypothetical protein